MGYEAFTTVQPAITLSYFNLTGLAEPIRLLLVYMNWNFTDHRIPYDQWLDVKKDYPFGKVPCFTMDGVQYHQSRAVGRYLARKAGLYGIGSEEDDMKIDMLVDTIDDMRQAVAGWYYEKDPILRKNKYNPMLLDTLPYYLSKLNIMARENNGFLLKKNQVRIHDAI
uniref:glutathione transferase n=1 Tax=Cacopsylla melanoneura TaxID=428564 RepID=A0A8D9A5N3_9HEMI